MHVVIDGYNVMHSLPTGLEWPGVSFKDRREAFLDRLNAYSVERSHRITVVFDGARGGDPEGGSETYGIIRVVYSPRGVEADAIIREIVESDPRPGDLLVVSSDKGVSGYSRSLGASVARADEMVGKVWPMSILARGNQRRGRATRKKRQRHSLW